MPMRAAITIGTFDGVHVGHAALVRAARGEVGESGRVVAVAFDPHPAAVLRPQCAPPRLALAEQKRQWLRDAGADHVELVEPTAEFLAQSPEEFMAWLADRFAPAAIVEGADFRFGRARAGTVGSLRAMERTYGYRTVIVDPVEVALSDQALVRASSSIARWLLGHGRVREAAIVLGRPYELRCPVVAGDRRGRDIGVPTANLDHGELLLPMDGIYAGSAVLPSGRRVPAAISVGTKPTFGRHPRVCEAHLLDYDGPVDDYGWMITLRLERWLRDQLVYADVPRLLAQLQRDIAATRQGACA
jgi:riboflavin kinase / FMN adenylyltransferase